ncbi:MAG: hypothetical protein IAE82_02770 [Opitutaceae bacterium]|nr:hypothetical protein [Opitutaceae bacterium]
MSWTFAALDARLAALPPSHNHEGIVTCVCVRPDLDQRAFPDVLELCPRRGAIGDRWKRRTWMYLPDGHPDPRVQVAIAHAPTIALIQDLTGNPGHPGDTLLVDLDLSVANVPAGTRLRVGTSILEVSDVENDGCAKFAARHGAEVLAWIRAPTNRSRRLRGLFAQVIHGGVVRRGDAVEVVRRTAPGANAPITTDPPADRSR